MMAISKVISFIAAKFRVSPEQIEATRGILPKPPALLAVLKSASPLPKEVLQDPSLAYIYPASILPPSFNGRSACMAWRIGTLGRQ